MVDRPTSRSTGFCSASTWSPQSQRCKSISSQGDVDVPKRQRESLTAISEESKNVKKIVYRVGDKVYLNYPSGRFRPIGGVTKFTKVNNGPYTVLADTFHGLVYRVKHDITGFVSNVSITRMIPAEARSQLEGAVRLPAQMDYLPGELPPAAAQEAAEQKDAPDSEAAGADRGVNYGAADMEISDEEVYGVEDEEEEDKSANKEKTWITGRDTKKREEAEAQRQ